MPGINHNNNWKLHARLEYLISLKTYCIRMGLQKPEITISFNISMPFLMFLTKMFFSYSKVSDIRWHFEFSMIDYN